MTTTTRSIEIAPGLAFGGDNPPLFIAGPCVIESQEHVLKMARTLARLRDELKINLDIELQQKKAEGATTPATSSSGTNTK